MPSEPASTKHLTTKDDSKTTVCPFCALLCDDLKVRKLLDHSFEIRRNGCSRADRNYARLPATPQALVKGRAVDLEAASTAIARLLRKAEQPLIAGLGTDVDGMRAVIRLAERCGAALDHTHSEALNTMAKILQSRGGYSTTLSEIRNRADLVLLVGVDLRDRYENFARLCLDPKSSLHARRHRDRRVVSLGGHSFVPQRPGIEELHCTTKALPETLNRLLAILRNGPLAGGSFGGISRKTLQALASAIQNSAYCAIVFEPAALGDCQETMVSTIFDIVDEVNRDSRAAGLALGGDDGGQSAIATCTWLTGYPLRVRFGETIEYDPIGNALGKLLAPGGADALLWIDSFGGHPNPPLFSPLAHTIVLSAIRPKNAGNLGAFIPIGTPGIDHYSRLVRTDSVVTLPLDTMRTVGLPNVSTVLSDITEKL